MQAFILLALVSAAYGQCVRTNAMGHAHDLVILNALSDLDKNNNNQVEDMEIVNEFVGQFDKDGSLSISKAEFVAGWTPKYHDNAVFAEHLFTFFDVNNDGSLGLFDVMPLKTAVDKNRDGHISDTEFIEYMAHAYKTCDDGQN